jgi:hypothetical protein
LAEPTPILTEARVREVFREYQRLTSPGMPGGLEALMRGVSMLAATPQERMAAVAESLSSEPVQGLLAVTTERQRAEAIAKLIGLLGVDEARAQATALSVRAAAEGQDLFERAWK